MNQTATPCHRPARARWLLALPALAALLLAALAPAPPRPAARLLPPPLLAVQPVGPAAHRPAPVPADTSHGALAGILADVRRRSFDLSAAQGAGLTAGNYRQHLAATLAATRYTVAADTTGRGGAAWQLGLTLQGIGREGAASLCPVADTAARPALAGGHASYRQPGFLVDYDNTEAGVRQTYRLPARPAGTGPVQVTLALATSLRAEASADTAVVFSQGKSHAPMLHYGSLRAWDATGRRLPATMQLAPSGQALALVVDDAGAAYPITIDPLASTAGATLSGGAAGDTFATSVALVGDLNGDGYGDLAVGAPGYSGGAGAVYLYRGSSTGLGTTAATLLQGGGTDNLGASVAGAGDFNGDGYGDLLVGGPGYGNGIGVAYIYGGGPSFFTNPLALAAGRAGYTASRGGTAVAGVGDVNGDGYNDFAYGCPAYSSNAGDVALVFGNASFNVNTATDFLGSGSLRLGASLAGLGDLNGDGYADLAAGAPGVNAVLVVRGANATTSSGLSNFLLQPGGAGTGTSVAGPGDVNGDGYADLLIGAPGAGTGGVVYVYQGSTTLAAGTAPTATLANPNAVAGDQYGQAVSGAGDTNGDGYVDFAVGSPGYSGGSGKGAVYVYGGTNTAGTYGTPQTYVGEATGDQYGSSLSGGDVNGDGYGDLLVGAPANSRSTGRAYAYYGGPAPLTATSPASAFSEPAATAGPYFGYRTVAAGDVNGDGYADVLVGTYTNNNTPGRAYLYLGSSTGLAATPTTLARPAAAAGDYFGAAVAGAGDVNGDGYADVLVGAPGASSNQGRAYLYLGGSGGLAATPTTLTEPGAANGNDFGYRTVAAGDVNGDGYADLLIGAPAGDNNGQGRAYLYLGSATGPAATPLTLIEPGAASAHAFGWSMAQAGDVNGDGYADVLVGSGYVNAQGRVYLYLGSSTGLAATPTTTLARAGAANYDEFGQNLSGTGDVNGDGYADVLLGAYGVSSSQGRAYLYLGGSSGLAATPTTTLTEPTPASGNYFGTNVGSAGDTNGDGYADVLVGANGTSSNQGRAYLYLGGSGGLAATPTTLAEPGSTSSTGVAYFGISLNAVGDVNGDGYGDLAIGADAANNNAGRFYLYPGNQGAARAGGLRLYNTDYTPISASNYASPQFGLGLTARNVAGRVQARVVWEVVGRGQAFTGSPAANSTASSGRGAWTNLPASGTAVELRALATKVSRASKVRARLEYASSPLAAGPPNGTGGPASRVRYGPWTYVAAQQAGVSAAAATPLPVQLVAFTAAAGPAAAQLAWTTASEANSARFEVERSLDGSAWGKVGAVAAAGSSATARAYAYRDAPAPAGLLYYRLRQVDQDGTSSYSPVRTVMLGAGGLALYPNPAHGGAATLTGAAPGAAVTVLDALGRVVATATTDAAGTVALGGLAPGLYVVQAGRSSARLAVE